MTENSFNFKKPERGKSSPKRTPKLKLKQAEAKKTSSKKKDEEKIPIEISKVEKKEIFAGSNSIFSDEEVAKIKSKKKSASKSAKKKNISIAKKSPPKKKEKKKTADTSAPRKKPAHPIFRFVNFLVVSGIFFMIIQTVMNYEALSEKVEYDLKSSEEKDEMQKKYQKISNADEKNQEKKEREGKSKAEFLKNEPKNTEEEQVEKEQKKKLFVPKFRKTPKIKKKTSKFLKLPEPPGYVVPFDSRLIIPKIGKNVPIVFTSAENLKAGKLDDLDKDILKALKDGVIHYPGTALPGEEGNIFITGHSSYYPWDDGRYKDVFALLHELEVGNEFTIFYNQKDFHYRIFDKRVVDPKDVEVMNQGSGEMVTLMTCSPVGTNLKRLILRAYSSD